VSAPIATEKPAPSTMPCAADSPVAGTARVAWRIDGLDCPDCARSVGIAVERIPGVACVDLNYASATLLVDYDPAVVPVTDIVEMVTAAGYGAIPLGDAASAPPAAERRWIDRNLAEVATVGAGGFTAIGGALALAGAPEVAGVIAFAVAIGFGGLLVWRRAWMSLKARVLDMNVLMTVAVVGAALLGEWGEGATVYFLFALGGLLEARSLDRTRRSIRDLMSLAPQTARVKRDGLAVEMLVAEVALGDIFVVRPGERIALDGAVISGASAVDEAAITGESTPAEKTVGDRVFAGSLNESGLLEVEATALATDSTLARIVYLVEEAQASRAPSQTLVERFTRWYTPTVIALAAAIAIIPPLAALAGGAGLTAWSEWVRRALVLLVVSCPCALVISTPVSIVSGITRASRDGVLVKGGAFLETAAAVDAVAFDKTGTLTHGRPEVVELVTFGPLADNRALEVAAALESHSTHPIARAVVSATDSAVLPQPSGFIERPGVGVSGIIDGVEWEVASPVRADEVAEGASEGVRAAVEVAEAAGRTALVLLEDRTPVAVISVADTVRPESAEVMRALKGMGVQHVVMLTGDNEAVAQTIAAEIGLTGYLARLLPEAKTEAVRALKERYRIVAMVGDGVNDAPALAAADISIAMGAAGSDTALETADVALMRDDLGSLPGFFALGRRTVQTIRANVAFSIIVKAVFVVLALTGNATLWMAVFADTGVSLLVILNGMRLLRTPARS
jgi:Cd2+/Zn2+-exporting ATPase